MSASSRGPALIFLVGLMAACGGGSVGLRDTDGDFIADVDEGAGTNVDTDGDGTPDFEDGDSDGDGFSDAVEAGDADPATPPADTDGDGVPDFRDLDSDGDGLADAQEASAGTSRSDSDSDGDGVTDLVEVAIGSDPLDAGDTPGAPGDVVALVPPEGEASALTLSFQTHVREADVYFLFDKSGGMQDTIDAMSAGGVGLLGDLVCADGEEPATGRCVVGLQSGVGQYHNPYNHLLSLQPDPAEARDTMGSIVSEDSISREDFFEAVTCMADGTCGTGCTPPVGCPGFRAAALRLALVFTSEDSDDGTLEEAAVAMTDAGIRFAGIYTGEGAPEERADMEALAAALGAFRADGLTPRVLDGEGAEAVSAAADAVAEMLFAEPLRVTSSATDAEDDGVDATAFVASLVTQTSGVGECTAVALVEDGDLDGDPDTFPELPPGTSVCWDLVARRPDELPAGEGPRAFPLELEVTGDGSPLDARRVWFVVP